MKALAEDKLKSYIKEMADGELEWHQEAVCAQTDPEIFFPEGNASLKDAINICKTCPVATQCLEYAMKNTEVYGIWGGTTARQRTRLRNLGKGRPVKNV